MTPFGRLDDALLTTSKDHVLVDFVEEGAPLVITFGFYFETGHPAFEFLGRLRKLEAVSGRAINKILVRDPTMRWYLGGIAGLGDDVPETAAALRALVDRLAPSAVITVGQSMGAYGAMLYGALIGADKAVPFGPLSCFDRRRWDLIGDARWQAVLDELDRVGLDYAAYADLPPFLAAQAAARETPLDIDLLYGGAPSAEGASTEGVGHDVAHAIRFADTPGVTLLPVRQSVHAVVEHFRSLGVITEVLANRLFGAPLEPAIDGLRGDPWVAWVLENLERGSTLPALRPPMLAQLAPEQADHQLRRAGLITDLERVAATPPVFTA